MLSEQHQRPPSGGGAHKTASSNMSAGHAGAKNSRPAGRLVWLAAATCLLLAGSAFYLANEPRAGRSRPAPLGAASSADWSAASGELAPVDPRRPAQRQQWLVMGAEASGAGASDDDEQASFESSDDGPAFGAAASSHKSFNASSAAPESSVAPARALSTTSDLRSDRARVAGGLGLEQLEARPPAHTSGLVRNRRVARLEKRPILNEFSFPANLVQGMRFVLMCQVLDGEAPVQIKWFKDNQELGLEFGKLQEEQIELLASEELGSASLLFRRVQQQHSGNYTCSATNHFGSASYSSFMSVKVPPRWKVEPQDQESIMGEQITIDCQAFGNPSPFIRWKFTSLAGGQQQHPMSPSSELAGAQPEGGRELGPGGAAAALALGQSFKLINSNHHVQTLENGSLTIRQANKDHEGLYLCEADNGVEPSLIKVLRLVVHLQAQFADDIQAFEGPGSYLLLSAQVPAAVGGSQPAAGGGGGGGQLALAFPGKQQPMAAAAATALATAAANSAPRTVRVMQNATQLRLLCQPFGDQPLTLDWLKDGQLIYTHSAGSQQQAALDPSSSAGAAPSSSSPAASSSPMSAAMLYAHQHERQQQQQQQQQQQALFLQQLGQRFHANTRRSAQRPQNGLDSELLITGLRRADAGVYTCLARNLYGQAERRLRLVVQEPPEPPEVVDVAHIGSRSIGLRWLAPFDGNSAILKYVVEFRRLGPRPAPLDSQLGAPLELGAGQSEKVLPPRLDSDSLLAGPQQQQALQSQQQAPVQVQHTVHDLEPLTRYSMRVLAVNAVGRSRPSVALSLRTEEEVPSVVPSLVEASVLSSKSIKLHWTISYSPDHEIIEGFFVGYRSFESSAEPSGGGASSAGGAPAGQAGLGAKGQQLLAGGGGALVEQPTFTYKTIRLTSQPAESQAASPSEANSDFPGSSVARQQQSSQAFLAPISSVTRTLPASASASSSLPQATIGAGTNNLLATVGSGGAFHLSSSSPSSSGANINQRLSQQQQQVIVVSAFEYLIGGLERNTEYSIQIQCFNKKGAGPTSDPVVFKTFLNDPPEKLALSADEVSESSVRLSWRFLAHLNEHPALASSPTSKQAAAGELVDGYVLTFAKLGPNRRAAASSSSQRQQTGSSTGANVIQQDSGHLPAANNASSSRPSSATNLDLNSYSSAARISNVQPAAVASSPPAAHSNGIDGQWQAIQLAPQQRSHQLKNLDCGSSYSMKIWAFNKIGKGEQSEPLTVSTRGKAPAPSRDARAFLSVNSTQVRLHLNAWDDGGCDIDKFVVQYRARGQLEWTLVSNNILKEQVSVVIRDLLPATRYELLVSAQNQVGSTEVIYKFATLDSDGKQVFPLGHSFLGGEGDDSDGDYITDPDGTTRREHWPSAGYSGDGSGGFGGRPVWLARQLLASPLALLLASCCFVVLLALLLLYRFNGLSSSSTETLSSSDKSGGTTSRAHRRPSTEANTVIGLGDNDGHLGVPLSVANDSLSDSPRSNPLHQHSQQASSMARYSQANPGGYQPSECHYQSFCGGGGGDGTGAPDLLSQQQAADAYARSAALGQQQSCSPYVAAYGQVGPANNYATAGAGAGQTPYASVQRSATMDPTGGSAHEAQMGSPASDQRQHCMMQLLMMGNQPQQQHNANGNSHEDQSYNLTAALTTMARSKGNNLKLLSNQMAGHLSYGGAGSPHPAANANLTLGRPHQMLDYHRLSAASQQQHHQAANAGNSAQAMLSEFQHHQ